MSRKLLRLWISSGSNAIGRRCQVVRRVSKLNILSNQEPVRTRLPKWHPDAAGVNDPRWPYHPIELHVRVTTDDETASQSLENWQ